MIEILRRMQEEDQSLDYDSATESIEESVHGLGLDTDIELVWKHLTEYEKEEYQRML